MTETTRRHIVNLALKLQGIPYIWGGNSPEVGFDCSGFVIWILQVFEVLPAGDWTAQGLANYFAPAIHPEVGNLAFYGKDPNKITHVMMVVNEALVIGASGGDSSTTSREEAKKRGAKVKVKPIGYRSDFQFVRTIGSHNGNP